jgi:hypothetical protein
MRAIRVFEPALCCNTGVCGPELDQNLVDFTADLAHLKAVGADIERHNLANDPVAFAGNDAVREFLQVVGSAGLPLTLVDGVTVMTGQYPSREQLQAFAGVAAAPVVPVGATTLGLLEAQDTSESECCGGGGCC